VPLVECRWFSAAWFRADPDARRPAGSHHRAMVVARVVVVDDNAQFRAAAGLLLAAGGLVVVGTAATGAEALTVATAQRPDVVLLDVQLPDVDGFTVCAELAASGIPVVLCSVRDHTGRLAGSAALGFIRKENLSAAEVLRLLGDTNG
jgi:CheY-like chemotaxis protein